MYIYLNGQSFQVIDYRSVLRNHHAITFNVHTVLSMYHVHPLHMYMYGICFPQHAQARHIAPNDSLLLFNLALVEQRSAIAVLRNETSKLPQVVGAVRELEMAQR